MGLKFNPLSGTFDWVSGGGGGSPASNSFAFIQTPNGTSPAASSPTDVLTYKSSNNTVDITGDELDDSIDFKVGDLGSLYLKLDGSNALAADLDMGTNKITNVGDPTSAQDAATKIYTDRATNGWRKYVAAIDASRTSLPTSAPLTVDGRTIATGDDVLFTALSSGTNNAVYTATVSGSAVTWTLRKDGANFDGTPTWGDRVVVRYGTANGGATFTHYGVWVRYFYWTNSIYFVYTSNSVDFVLDSGSINFKPTGGVSNFVNRWAMRESSGNSIWYWTKDQGLVTTTSATPTVLPSYDDLNAGTAPYILSWYVFGKRTDVAGDWCSFRYEAVYYDGTISGAAIVDQARGSNSGAPPGTCAATFSGNGNVTVTGVSGQTWKWRMHVEAHFTGVL